MRNYLASIEGTLQDLLLKCGVTEAQRLGENDAEKRRKKLLTMARKALQTLEDGDDPASDPDRPTYKAGPGSPSNEAAMSLEGFSEGQQAALAALSRRMGV